VRRTKIVATIGPASEMPDVLRALVAAGMDVARLNLSHGGRSDYERRLRAVLEVREQDPDRPLGILVDTRGAEVRIAAFPEGRVVLRPGDGFSLYPDGRAGDARGVGTNYGRLHADVRPGQLVLLDDGNLALRCREIKDDEVRCEVEVGGELLSGKKINLPGVDLRLPVLQPDDESDLRLAAVAGADFVAASFVHRAEDVFAVRRVLEAAGGGRMQIISKIESQQGVARADEILRASDGLMVARGDLGVELPAEEVPLVQKELIRKCLEAGKPVITATQMLESMVTHSRPTRAEASDVANAIFDGSDAVMLSAETAIGAHVIETVRTMARIAERAEQALPFREMLQRRAAGAGTTVPDAISYATALAAQNLGAAAILTVTQTGLTARGVAKYRPRNPVLAMVVEPEVGQQLSVVWGVRPLPCRRGESIEATLQGAVRTALERRAIEPGDLVIITAGSGGGHGSTNTLQVQTVGEVALRGQGVGGRAVTGRVVVVRGADDGPELFRPGDVVVVAAGARVPPQVLERAGAIIGEEAGLTAAVAELGLALDIPAIVGASGASSVLRSGDIVTVDSARGLCYRGHARAL
jgi:pyruvate kinase